MRIPFPQLKILVLFLFCCIFGVQSADAHVKWFTSGSYADRPLTLGEVINQLFLILLGACIVVISLGVYLDNYISRSGLYNKLNSWLEIRKDYAYIIMRVAAAMLFLLSWQSDAMLAPTLKLPEKWLWLGWYQFILALFLIIPKTVPLAGFGIILIYVFGIWIYDPFHMLDYILFIGCGFYLGFRRHKSLKLQSIALTLLYITLGFSLCWVALEKFIYPDWSLFLLKKHPDLALGLNYNFFVTSIAFVEFSLGYLLLVCLLQRPLAVIISIVFLLTTLTFGKTEVIGHTLIHGCLIVFLLEGPGLVYQKIASTFKNIFKRILANSLFFILLLIALISAYHSLAQNKYDRKQKALENKSDMHIHSQIELAGMPKDQIPSVTMQLFDDEMGGYNLLITTSNFRFSPQTVNQTNVIGEGHAHLHIDGVKTARIYSNWYHIDALPPGAHTISVTLNSNRHEDYVYRGNPIEDSKTVVVKDK
ncbi:MAG: hypothetical protein ACKVPJ_12365 [Chitinophagales bacterium]